MKLTPSQVKNLMRRGLRFLVDPEPETAEKARCIAYFEHRCAYCGQPIDKGRGDLDHLVSAAQGGRNHISNRVFSCKPCNAEEKRDRDWEEFLEGKCLGPELRLRRNKIVAWVKQAGAVAPLPPSILNLLDEASKMATTAYDKACTSVRAGAQQPHAADRPASAALRRAGG